MATRLAKPCAAPGCAALVNDGSRCATHASQRQQERGTAHERGYDFDWQRFRAMVIIKRPCCEDCLWEPSLDVHHILKLKERPDLRLDERNVLALCKPCHSRRTQKGM